MDFVNQLKHFWSELGLNQKVSIGVALLAIAALMLGLLFWSGRPQMVLLYGGLDPKDLSSVAEGLDGEGISYELRNGNSVYVPRSEVYKARMNLASQGVPSGGGVGFEIFDRTNFGISDFVQRTNYLRAVQGELGRTIQQLNGVREARVMIVIPENRLLVTGETARSTASVFVDTGGTVLELGAVNSIRNLVANSVEGLAVNDVVVVDANGNPLSDELESDGVIGAATGQFKFRQNLEDYFTKKVETMLARVVGQRNVVARVSVDIETEASTLTEEKYDPNGQVVRTQTTNDESSTSREARTEDVVGASANAPGVADTANGGTESSSTESRKNKSVTYEINRSTVEVVRQPGEIRNISAAVFVAQRFREENGERIAEPRSPEELDRLREMVVNAIGATAEADGAGAPSVTLTESDFAPDPMAPTGPMVQVEDQVTKWAERLRGYVAVGIAVIMFLLFLRMLKRHKPEPINFEVVDDTPSQKKIDNDAPRLTADLLNELIREKPENVSTALKSWALEQKKG